MGIPYFFYSLYKKYNKTNDFMICEKDLHTNNIDYLFLDYNSMIHPCAQNVITKLQNESITTDKPIENDTLTNDTIENLIIKECLLYTEFIINIINAKNVYIMIDGVAPMAKIIQQRERRYKSYFFKNITNNNENYKHIWDTNKITPGTLFMKKLSEQLNTFSKKISDCKIIVSDSNDSGEGEHKMMKVINAFQNINSDICIYGLDADLIMLSLLNKFSNNIILLRDNTFNTKSKEEDRKFTYLSIGKLKSAVLNEIKNEYRYFYKTDIVLNNDQIINDYIFLCILLGNDFLHNIPSLLIKENASQIIIKSYIKCIKNESLTCHTNYFYNTIIEYDKIINIKLFNCILYELSCVEDYFFKNVYSLYRNKKNEGTQKPSENNYSKNNKEKVEVKNEDKNYTYKDEIPFELLESENIICYKDDIIMYNKDEYKNRYYAYYNIIDINNCCKEYLEGIYWIWGYYNLHIHDNWSWMYKEHSAPFISDIYNYLNNNIVAFTNYIKSSDSFIKNDPITPLKQLMIVLPKMSLLNIIKELDFSKYLFLERLFRCNSKIILNLFPNKITIDMIHKEYLWQSRIFFNEFDIVNLNYIL